METGRVLAGNYRLVEFLTRGGMGEVWRGYDESLHRTIAVKLLSLARIARGANAGDLPLMMAMFEREARAMASITSSHVAVIHAQGREDDLLYLVMEYIEGGSRAEKLWEDKQLTLEQTVRWTRHICEGLAAAHGAGVIHRDIKPSNVMLTRQGDAKIVDFGIARFRDATESNSAHATWLYASPERCRSMSGDHRTDLYSLGCVVYEMLTGRTPFGNIHASPAHLANMHLHDPPTPPGAHRAGIPEALDWLVLRMLAKHPDDRPQDADEVRRIIERILRTPGHTEGLLPSRRPPSRQNPHVKTENVQEIRELEQFILERAKEVGAMDTAVLDARTRHAELTGSSGDARGAAALYRRLGDDCAGGLGRLHPRVLDAFEAVARWTDSLD